MSKNRVRLPDGPRALKLEYGIEISYDRLYKLVLNGKVPAERIDNRFYELGLDLVAAALIQKAA